MRLRHIRRLGCLRNLSISISDRNPIYPRELSGYFDFDFDKEFELLRSCPSAPALVFLSATNQLASRCPASQLWSPTPSNSTPWRALILLKPC